MSDAFIVDAVRTPRGRGRAGGTLNEIKPVTLLVGLLKEMRERHQFPTAAVEEFICGVVHPVSDQGSCIPRTAVLAAGYDVTVAGLQINRFCGSGLDTVSIAASLIRTGSADLMLAGGVESLSRVPFNSANGPERQDPETALQLKFINQGVAADLLATLYGYTREQLDTFGMRSHQRAALAWREGRFSRSVVPVRDRNGLMVLDHDEIVRGDTTLQKLATLKPSFKDLGNTSYDALVPFKYPQIERVNHVHTAGNSSGVVDGASLVLLASEAALKAYNLKPRARVVSSAVIGQDLTIMVTGPVPTAQKALKRAGLTVDEIDVFEVNEAFAVVPLYVMDQLRIPEEKVNIGGGAIAMGHPLGATGAMLIGHCIDELERTGGHYGLITLCTASGMGTAAVIERV